MNKPTKTKLLQHYLNKEPHRFIQVDVHDVSREEWQDSIMRPNEHGFCLMGGERWELMNGAELGVRVLIHPDMPPERIQQAMLEVLDLVSSSQWSHWLVPSPEAEAVVAELEAAGRKVRAGS